MRRVGYRCLIRITGFGWVSAGPIYFMIISTTRNDNCNICCDLEKVRLAKRLSFPRIPPLFPMNWSGSLAQPPRMPTQNTRVCGDSRSVTIGNFPNPEERWELPS